MGLFGGNKKDDGKGAAGKGGEGREKPTTARRSRRIVQPGAAKPTAPGATRSRSPEPQVRRAAPSAPRQAPAEANDDLLQLDDFVDTPAQAAPARRAPASSDVPDLEFQGSLDADAAAGGPSRSGDGALLEFLVDKVGLISAEQAQSGRQMAHDEGLALDAALVRQGSITEDALVSALTKECWVPHLKVDKYEIRKKALSTISADDARRFGVLPVDKLGSILNLAMVNPLDEEAIRHLEAKTNLEIKKVVASRSEIEGGIAKYFGGEGSAPQLESNQDGSRIFSQDLPTAPESSTQQLAKATAQTAPAPAPTAAEESLPMDDFMDIADIDDLLGDGDEVAPALIEPVALEPLEATADAKPSPEAEPAPVSAATPEPQEDNDIFHDLTDTAAVEPEAPPTEAVEEVLDLEFQPEPAAEPAPEPAASDNFFDDLSDLEPTAKAPAASPAPAPTTASTPRSPSRSATKSFTAKPTSSLAAPTGSVEDLLPVTEEEFQNSIAHGRVRVFEKWVGIQTRNRILNAVPVDEHLDPLLAGLKESPYQVSA